MMDTTTFVVVETDEIPDSYKELLTVQDQTVNELSNKFPDRCFAIISFNSENAVELLAISTNLANDDFIPFINHLRRLQIKKVDASIE